MSYPQSDSPAYTRFTDSADALRLLFDNPQITPETFNFCIRRLGRYDFPAPASADPEGMGLVAVGADLAPETLISAYAQGLFPWFNEDEPIAWWCPEPRCVMVPSDYQPSKSLRKQVRRARWQITLNRSFDEVIHACSLPRSDGLPVGEHTWIHDEMIAAYTQLHAYGFAHSIEVWDEHAQLIGGLYGLKIGSIYFGESMFHHASNASKIAFWGLTRLCRQSGVALIDCQLPNDHLLSLGADTLHRADFLAQLDKLISEYSVKWHKDAYKALPVSELENTTLWQLQDGPR